MSFTCTALRNGSIPPLATVNVLWTAGLGSQRDQRKQRRLECISQTCPPRLPMFSLRPRYSLQYACRKPNLIICTAPLSFRFNSTAPKAKPTPALVQQLRKQTSCSIQKAIQALSSTGNDYKKALEWLSEDVAHSAQKTTTKLAGRTASNGLIAISTLSNGMGTNRVGNLGIPLRVGMVELNCETDFVARSDVFEKLARDVAWSVGFYADNAMASTTYIQRVDVDTIINAPMLYEPSVETSLDSPSSLKTPEEGSKSTSIGSAIANAVARVGEKIILKRAASISSLPFPLHSKAALSVGIYAHNTTAPKSVSGTSGTVASAILLQLRASNLRRLLLPESGSGNGEAEWRVDFRGLERALARQVVGFETAGVKASGPSTSTGDVAGGDLPVPLYAQEFHTYAPTASRNPRYEAVALDNLGRALEGWSSASGMEGECKVEVLEFLKWRVGEENA